MAYRRRRVARRGTTRSRRGRKLQQDGAVVVRRARNAALAGAIARYGPGVVRYAYNAGREALRQRRMTAREKAISDKRASRMSSVSTRSGRAGESSKVSRRYGRKARLGYQQLLRMSVPYRVMRFQGVKVQDNTDSNRTGYFAMPNQVSTTTDVALVPMYVLSLRTSGDAPVLRQAAVHSTGRVSWTAVNGLTNGGVNSTGMYVESANDSSVSSGQYDMRQRLWQDIRLNMYGARTQQTEFVCELVRPVHDYACVEDEGDLLASTGVHADFHRDTVYGWWLNKLKSMVTNPIAAGAAPQRGSVPFVVMKRWTFKVKPALTIERDDTANSVVGKIFLNDGVMLNHAWPGTATVYDATRTSLAAGADEFLVNPNHVFLNASGTKVLSDVPSPRMRKYLVIRAVNTSRVLDASESVDNTPSFDLVYRCAERLGSPS